MKRIAAFAVCLIFLSEVPAHAIIVDTFVSGVKYAQDAAYQAFMKLKVIEEIQLLKQNYDASVQMEFPLETKLWNYLQTLHSPASTSLTQDRAKQALNARLDVEKQAADPSDSSWITYLMSKRRSLDSQRDAALESGATWLAELLDRYRPLPSPLLA